jgi:hypothetical protein
MSHSQTQHDADVKCQCGENRPEAMTRRGCCYECSLIQDGRKRTEDQHPFGRVDRAVASISLEIPGNWHRAFDARRARRPDILKRPGDNPLQQVAAVVATFGEVADATGDFACRQGWPAWIYDLADILAKAAAFAADWLLILAGKLDEWCGPDWVNDMPTWQPR